MVGKKLIWCLLALLCLTGCTEAKPHSNTVLVSLVPAEGCIIPANGQRVCPGEDAVFEIALEEGYAIVSADYPGAYELFTENGKEFLRLFDVRYPTRVRLQVSSRFRSIHYEPNGGSGQPKQRIYDTRDRIRPNTDIGTALFQREGHTLIGWNTRPDGTGQRVGLGSRVSIPGSELTLYAQWAKWADETDFLFVVEDGVIITGYIGSSPVLAIPDRIQGIPVKKLAADAFANCPAHTVILPPGLQTVESGAFSKAELQSLVVFDNIQSISSSSFSDCSNLQTVYINAQEQPYGYQYRKETCLADKLDLLIEAQGQRKLVFYGGCSMWYNLNGEFMQQQLGDSYRVINAGLNGMINSAVQLQIITAYLEKGDIFFHTPELSSKTQLMSVTALENHDDKLWCGLELNYDLLSLVDARDFPNLLDSWNQWLDFKQTDGSYDGCYKDSQGRSYLDRTGSIPFFREIQEGPLDDLVYLDPDFLQDPAMSILEQYYTAIQKKGVRVYVSHACVNMDAVPPEQRENIALMDHRFRQYLEKMDSAVMISSLADYLYYNDDFFDTNYHLLSSAAQKNTELWLRDLMRQMERDGLWLETP